MIDKAPSVSTVERKKAVAHHWQSHRVEELIKKGLLAVGDGYRAKNSELCAVPGLPFARAGNIQSHFDFEGADYFPEKDLSKVGEKVSQPGDVVFTSKGTVGRFAFVQKDTPRFVYSPQLCYWRSLDAKALDARFLYYWMRSREFGKQSDSVKGQTDMADYVSLTDQRRMILSFPDIPEQRQIAETLSAFDEKIDLNRCMNRTLETMARAIFKSWFVDFDPVRAKMEKRPYPLPAEILGLFPDSFQDSPLGEIPKGWSVGKMSNILTLEYGDALKADIRQPGNVPVYGSNGQVGWHNKALVKGPGIVVGRKGNPGFVTWVPGDFFPIDTTFYVAPKLADASMCYLFNALVDMNLPSLEADSAVPGLNRNTAHRNDFLIPPTKVLEAFDHLSAPLLHMTKCKEDQSRNFGAARDALLPKLMSGEIRA